MDEMEQSESIRRSFPSLPVRGAYLDSAAKTLTCLPALEAMSDYYQNLDANVDRGIYIRSANASLALEDARSSVASMICVPQDQLAFFPSTTWAINAVANGIAWNSGDRVATTVIEHHSNFLPWLNLRNRGVDVAVVKSSPHGYIDSEDLARKSEGARLVAFTHASNALGTLQDIQSLTETARERGAMVLIDGAQGVSHENTDVGAVGPDAYAFSGHKCFGPTGIGAMYLSRRLLDAMKPSILGGGSAGDSSPEGFTLRTEPATAVFEPGTPNIAGIIGFGAAASFRLSGVCCDAPVSTEALSLKLLEGLLSIPGVEVFGCGDTGRRIPVASFSVSGYSPHQVGMLLSGKHEIMVRTGHHCTPTLWKTLYGRTEGAVRASLHWYSTAKDVDALLEAVALLKTNR